MKKCQKGSRSSARARIRPVCFATSREKTTLLDPPGPQPAHAISLAERKSALRGLRAIYRAPTKRAAVAAYWRFALTWRPRHPRLVAALDRDLDSLLSVFDLPAPIRPSLRTTNLIERAFRELRRRLRPIGALSDRRSADRILYGQVTRLNDLLVRRPLAQFTQES